MDVKEAIAKAKQYVRDVFSDDSVSNIGLEEVGFDEHENNWLITIGFFPPWQVDGSAGHWTRIVRGESESPRDRAMRRAYKIVTISDNTGNVVSVKNREIA